MRIEIKEAFGDYLLEEQEALNESYLQIQPHNELHYDNWHIKQPLSTNQTKENHIFQICFVFEAVYANRQYGETLMLKYAQNSYIIDKQDLNEKIIVALKPYDNLFDISVLNQHSLDMKLSSSPIICLYELNNTYESVLFAFEVESEVLKQFYPYLSPQHRNAVHTFKLYGKAYQKSYKMRKEGDICAC